MEKITNQISEALQAGDVNTVQAKIKEGLENEITPRDLLNEGLLSGMSIIGEKFKNNEVFVPEVLIAARAMNGGMEILKPKLIETGVEAIGKIIIGTVKGDLHDIGKNLVGMMIESGGYVVIDLGTDLEPEKFVEAVKEYKPEIVGMSALLTTTMLAMKETIEVLKEEGLRDGLKIMIGGAPVSKEFADEIDADGYAPDAASATELVEKLINA